MPYDTISLGVTLQVPTAGTKNWAKTYLDQFAKKLSSHDHTGSGKGLQLGTNAFANAAVTAAKIANLGAGTTFSPTLFDATGVASSTLTGIYWTFGPFIIVRYGVDVNYNNVALFRVKMPLPVLGSAVSGNAGWFGNFSNNNEVTTDGLQDTSATLTIGSGATDYMVLQYGPQIAATTSQRLTGVAWGVYPVR